MRLSCKSPPRHSHSSGAAAGRQGRCRANPGDVTTPTEWARTGHSGARDGEIRCCVDETDVCPLYRGEVRSRAGLGRGPGRDRGSPLIWGRSSVSCWARSVGWDGQGRSGWRPARSGRGPAPGKRRAITEVGRPGGPPGAAAPAGPPRRPDPPSFVAAVPAAQAPPRSALRARRPGKVEALPIAARPRFAGGGPIHVMRRCISTRPDRPSGGSIHVLPSPIPARPRLARSHPARPRFTPYIEAKLGLDSHPIRLGGGERAHP